MDSEVAETIIANDINMINQPDELKITGIGAQLKNAREAMHLSEKEAAARLYLNPKIISIIENECFSDGPPITFMRGYLRSYARLLNLPENEIQAGLTGMENTFPQPKSNTPVLHATPINHSDRYIRWITYLIVITLIVLVSLWWSSHSKYAISDVPSPETVVTTNSMETIDPSAVTTSSAANSSAMNTDAQTQIPSGSAVTQETPSAHTNTSSTQTYLGPTAPDVTGTLPAKDVSSSAGSPTTNAISDSTSVSTSPVLNNSAQSPLSTAGAVPPQVPTSATTTASTPTGEERDGNLTQANPSSKNDSGSETSKKQKKQKKHKSVISNMAIALPD